MKEAIEILKNIFLPILEESKNRNPNSVNWENLVKIILSYSDDPVIAEKELSKIPLKNSQLVLTELPDIYDSFIEDLAEKYVLGSRSDLTDTLSNSNELFKEKINFFNLMKGVLTKLGRENFIEDLKADEIISEKDIEMAFKKKGREELRNKFKEWDLEDEEKKKSNKRVISLPSTQNNPTVKSSVIAMWLRYAASILFIASTVMYYNRTYTVNKTELANQKMTVTVPVLKNSTLGFGDSSKKENINLAIQIADSTDTSTYLYDSDIILRLSVKSIEFNEERYIKINDSFFKLRKNKNPERLVPVSDPKIIKQLKKIIYLNK